MADSINITILPAQATPQVTVQPGGDITVNVAEPTETTVEISNVGIQGSQGPEGPEGPQGPQGNTGPAGGEAYVHTQTTPATVWTINHNLGNWPMVYVLDTNGDECEGNVDNPTINQTVITFSAAFAGTARLI